MGWMHCWGRRCPASSLVQTWTLCLTWRWSSASSTWKTSRSLTFLPLYPKSQAIMTLFMTVTNIPSLDLFFCKCILEDKLLKKDAFFLRLITMDFLKLIDLACEAYETSVLVEEPQTGPQVLKHSSPATVILSISSNGYICQTVHLLWLKLLFVGRNLSYVIPGCSGCDAPCWMYATLLPAICPSCSLLS